jgi:peptidyl-prolyl cis-trans isomerase C
MYRMQKKALIISLAITLSIFLMSRIPEAHSKETPEQAKVYATVGNEKITQADIDAKTSMLPPQFRERYETADGKKKLVEQLTKMSLLSQEARRLNIDKKEEVAKRIKEIADNLIIQELIKEEVIDKVKVSDADIEKYYNENKQEFVQPEKVKVNLIQFKLKENATSEEKSAQKKKASETLKRLKKDEDFEKVAKEVSEDERTKNNGGNTGFFSKGKRSNTYGPKVEDAAFSMKEGQISDIIEEKNGFYIIKVAEKKPEKEETLQEAKSKIERRLQQEQQKKAYDTYLDTLSKRYPVKIYDENITGSTPPPKPEEQKPAEQKPAQP